MVMFNVIPSNNPFVDYLNAMKPIRTALFGVLTSKNKKYNIIKHKEQIECSDFLLELIADSQKSIVAETKDKNNIFKYSWARCGIFPTAYFRLQCLSWQH